MQEDFDSKFSKNVAEEDILAEFLKKYPQLASTNAPVNDLKALKKYLETQVNESF